jgi:hypothetical protein
MPPEQSRHLTELEVPVVQKICEILLSAKTAADERRLIRLDPLAARRRGSEVKAGVDRPIVRDRGTLRRQPNGKVTRRTTKPNGERTS